MEIYEYKLRPTKNTNETSSYAITLPAEFVEKLGFHTGKRILKVQMKDNGIFITKEESS